MRQKRGICFWLTGVLLAIALGFPTAIRAESGMLDVPLIYQRPELPQGCEVTALAMAMNYRDLAVSKTELADNYVPRKNFYAKGRKRYGPNPFSFYAGNPRSESGWFCYAPPIVEGANRYFQEKGQSLVAEDLTGQREDRILRELSLGNPVLMWVTIGLTPIQYKSRWYFEDTDRLTPVPSNLHCVVLTGMDDTQVRYADPLAGYRSASRSLFFKRYYDLGGHAAVLYPQGSFGTAAAGMASGSEDFFIQTEEGSLPASTVDLPAEKRQDLLINIRKVCADLDMEWFISPVQDEIYLYNDQRNLTFRLDSANVIENKQKTLFRHPPKYLNKTYYLVLSDLEELLGVEMKDGKLRQKGAAEI